MPDPIQIPSWATPVDDSKKSYTIPSWAKPVEKEEDNQPEEESNLSKAWRYANTPLLNPQTQKALAELDPETSSDPTFRTQHPYISKAASFAMGVPTSMTTPLGLGLMAT